jgi:hypothetical protein
MSRTRAFRWKICFLVTWLLGAWAIFAPVHAAGTGHFGGARIGGMGAYSSLSGGVGSPRSGSSIIRHGGTGFSIYSQRGVTRVIGEAPVSKRILFPDGKSARVIGDGSGGAYVFGAPGNHRLLGTRSAFDDHGP